MTEKPSSDSALPIAPTAPSESGNLLELYVKTIPFLQRARYYDHKGEALKSKDLYLKTIRSLARGCHQHPDAALTPLVSQELNLCLKRYRQLLEFLPATTSPSSLPSPRKSVDPSSPSLAEVASSKVALQEAEMREQILKCIVPPDPTYSWASVKGLPKAVHEIQKIVDLPLEFPELLTGKLKAYRTIFLYGPPGCGKTLLMKVIAANTDLTVFSVSAAVLFSKWLGESQKMLGMLYKIALEMAPAVIFIDEFDAIFSSSPRGESNTSQISVQLQKELQLELDGVKTSTINPTVTIVATNTPWRFDKALRRRFDRILYVAPPNFQAVCALILDYAQSLRSFSQLQFQWLAHELQYYTPAEIRQIFTQARYRAYSRASQQIKQLGPKASPPKVTMCDFRVAIQELKPCLNAGHKAEDYLYRFRDFNQTYGYPEISYPPHIFEQDYSSSRMNNPILFDDRWD